MIPDSDAKRFKNLSVGDEFKFLSYPECFFMELDSSNSLNLNAGRVIYCGPNELVKLKEIN